MLFIFALVIKYKIHSRGLATITTTSKIINVWSHHMALFLLTIDGTEEVELLL